MHVRRMAERSSNMTKSSKHRPFGLRDKLGYLFGDFGNDFTFILSSSFLLKFYTDVMGVPAAIVGVVMMIARFVDAFTDVTVGRLCDRSRITPQGKFRPWILRACVPVAVASFLIYQSGLRYLPLPFKVAYLSVTYILWGSVFYTAVNIPYGSMASAISGDPGDRQSLSTFRSVGSLLAGLVIGAGVPILAYDDVGGNAVLNGARFTALAGVFSVLAVICHLLCYFLVTERVRPREQGQTQRVSLRQMLFNAVKNRALIAIIAASIINLLATLTLQSMSNYVYPNVYRSTQAQSIATFLMTGGMLLSAGFAKPLAQRFGKAEVSSAANAIAALICLALFFLRPQNVWVYVLLSTVNFMALGVFTMVSWALITDVIDHQEILTGVREDGSVYALYSFARKLGQAASAGLSGFLLSAIGYSQETAFDPGVVSGIYSIATLLPAAGFAALAATLYFWYPLRKALVESNVLELKRRHEHG